tara:strand:- start:1719 stop:2918 length:1200 start_codon:yes stop_codon:yes gene_type:complete
MSAIIEDVQKQEAGSGLVNLYEIELTSSSSIYFYSGLETDLTTVQFRDKSTPSTIRTYSALPIQMTGFKRSSAGAIPRPKMTVANVLTTFGDALGNLSNDDLLGNKVIRRTTLVKYLYGQASDQNPPVEFPSEIWYIDRVHSENAQMVTFELAAAHDLVGITLPTRHAMANACSWIYKGSSYDKDEKDRVGGCTIDVQGRLFLDGTTYKNWVNVDDERVVVSTTSFTAYSGVSGGTTLTLNGYYSTSKTDAIRYNIDGSQTGSQTVTEYWQCKKAATKTAAGTPADGSAYFNRIRVYTTWANDVTYYKYTDDKLNPYVQYTANSLTKLWKTKHTNLNQTPGENSYWELGDACSKTLTGCAMRYNSAPITAGTASSTMKAEAVDRWSLPFGGFPSARRYS